MSLPSPQDRLKSFREQLTKNNVDAFIQSTVDAHQSEYVCNRDKRLGYLSCFTGSSGTILITQNEALLWTDGRYFIAANNELSSDWKLMKSGLSNTPSIQEYISKNINAPNGIRIGIDPYLTSPNFYKSLIKTKQNIISLNNNPIDIIWDKHQPSMPKNKVFMHNINYSGQTVNEKIQLVQNQINDINDCHALIVSSLDHIAWILNLRGNDIIYNPVFFSYLIITKNECYLYIDPVKLINDDNKTNDNDNDDDDDQLKEHLKDINICKYNDFLTDLKTMIDNNKTFKFWYDPRKANMAILNTIPLDQRYEKDDPIELMKSIKNDIEIKGFYNCHIRDGAAKSRFFAWIDQMRDSDNAQAELEKHTEWTFAEKLLSFRKEADLFVDCSFDTISSIGANGAIIHYHPTIDKHDNISINQMYLLDSGGQYSDGTTDTTRTIWLGINDIKPSSHQKECFTRVLKGVIALTKLIFPSNTKGPQIDSIARSYLWQIGLDYRHGTGHGVGSFLNVHEGPHGFSSSTYRRTLYQYGLKKNCIITNEPGYYEKDNFGIRIENLMVVIKANTKYTFDNQEFCTFDTCTMVPICKELIDVDIMSNDDINWLNEYHKTVYQNILSLMKTDYEKEWLKKATSPIVVSDMVYF